MHLYNLWLPEPVRAETARERENFAKVVKSAIETWRPDDPDSVDSTIKFIPIFYMFLKVRSDVSLEDVDTLLAFGFEVFHASQNNLYAQARWGFILTRLLRKFGKNLSIKVQWRPFYECLLKTHFKRNTGPEGWRLRQLHFQTVTYLVQCCRKFFPSGSANEIWAEFRSSLENPWHNSSLESSGFIKLFLPMNPENEDFFTFEWIKQCIGIWESIPNCAFWNIQWASILARCIKNYNFFDWECFLPTLFTKYLNMFDVPIGSGRSSYPYSLDVPANIRLLFSSKISTPTKAISKSIVYLLKPGSQAQEHLDKLVDLLEQFYHPSNGGRWTYSLERFLRYLIITFGKRLKQEQLNTSVYKNAELHLGKSERASFVKAMMKLIDRGQYSKVEALAETVAYAMSVLSYVDPSLMLPFITSRFHLALETDTATHQLKAAFISIAFSGRPISFSSVFPFSSDAMVSNDTSNELLMIALSNALLGMDANDPPKTLAAMQLLCSVFSNLPVLSDDNQLVVLTISFSEWLDEFFSRLFSMLRHLEPISVLTEGAQISTSSRTFLIEDHNYFSMLEILFGKLTKSLYIQALKKISKFVNTNVLPGATSEVGLLCSACVNANPKEAARYLIGPILLSVIASLKESPVSGYGGRGFSDSSFFPKASLSPALETSLEYHLKILSLAINYAGPAVLSFKEELKGAIASAFEAPSWKVNVAGDHLLRTFFGCLVFYYPIEQYKCCKRHPSATALEDWVSCKDDEEDNIPLRPIWHIPSKDELLLANELMDLHFRSALDDLLRICRNKIHSEAGNEKDHLKVTLLRILSCLHGVLSCLPDLLPSFEAGKTNDDYFLTAGAIGASVASRELREKAAKDMHVVCKYLLDDRSDDSVLLILVIRIMDALANIGSLESEGLSFHAQAHKVESASLIEPPFNFITPSHGKGKKRPRWVFIDNVYMHNMMRSSHSLYHNFDMDSSISAPDLLISLADDLLLLSLQRYETVRLIASRTLLQILKRWPSLLARCVLSIMEKLCDKNTPEHIVLGSCALLTSQTILRNLTTDTKVFDDVRSGKASVFSTFLLGLLSSSHHDSLKSQKAITEVFIKYNVHFSGPPKSFFRVTNVHSDHSEISDLILKISSMGFDTNGLHWRYHLMANRALLLLSLASKNKSNVPSEFFGKTTGHFLRNLQSDLPQSRMLAVSALNCLLTGSAHKFFGNEQKIPYLSNAEDHDSYTPILDEIIQEVGFFENTLSCLSNVHVHSDEGTSTKGNPGSVQSNVDKTITFFYFDFSAAWPRTPIWSSLLKSEYFYSSFARIFKRLVQENGPSVILALQKNLESFSISSEMSKQFVAAEAMAGILHSDIVDLSEAWESWIMAFLQKIILSSFVDSAPEWAACLRYAVTGKGKYGLRAPVLRYKILDCLLNPLPKTVATNVISKRYIFLFSTFLEISPTRMSNQELQYHNKLIEELLDNMSHSSAQIREVIGAALSVLCSNIQCFASFANSHIDNGSSSMADSQVDESWVWKLTHRSSEISENIQNSNRFTELHDSADVTNEYSFLNNELQRDINTMETTLHFVISSLKSGRSSFLLDAIIELLLPIFSLQETSHKDLSTLAKVAFELLKWNILPRSHLEKSIHFLSSVVCDPNWRTRFACLSYLRCFMYRHTFVLTIQEKSQIWKCVETLLVDSQVEVREHAAGVLASLLKGGDDALVNDFRDRAFAVALSTHKSRKQRNWKSNHSIAATHGAVLALVSSVLSAPYDMPSWLPDHVTLLARFISETSPVKNTVTKAIAEFRRTHADTWFVQKNFFTEEQLEILADTTSSSSYFA